MSDPKPKPKRCETCGRKVEEKWPRFLIMLGQEIKKDVASTLNTICENTVKLDWIVRKMDELIKGNQDQKQQIAVLETRITKQHEYNLHQKRLSEEKKARTKKIF